MGHDQTDQTSQTSQTGQIDQTDQTAVPPAQIAQPQHHDDHSPRAHKRGPAPELTAVVPVYNEIESIEALHAELTAALDATNKTYEILYIDDGSTDGSEQALLERTRLDANCRAFRFHHNRGKAAAYRVGFREAMGRVLVTLDADLQDDPAEIPRLLDTLEQGHDLVVGWKQGRVRNEPLKAIPSKVYNTAKAMIFGLRLRDSNCGFRVMRAPVASALQLYAGNYRFLPELAHQRGFRVTEAPVNHRERRFGKSKYGPGRFLSGSFDVLTLTLLTGFGHRPLHFFGGAGLLASALGAALEAYVLAMKLAGDPFQTHVAALIVGVMLIVLGIQLLGIGLIGEYVLALTRRLDDRPPHYVALDGARAPAPRAAAAIETKA